jgi:hypothetical protein
MLITQAKFWYGKSKKVVQFEKHISPHNGQDYRETDDKTGYFIYTVNFPTEITLFLQHPELYRIRHYCLFLNSLGVVDFFLSHIYGISSLQKDTTYTL